MGIINNINKNYEDYKNNPIIIVGNRVPLKEMRKLYFKKHNISFFKRLAHRLPLADFIVLIGREGFWLNEIFMLNLEKNCEIILNTLFEDSVNIKKPFKWTRVNEEIIGVIISSNKKKEIEKRLKLPFYR